MRQDNYTKHISNSASGWKINPLKLKILISNARHGPKQAFHAQKPSNMAELKQLCNDCRDYFFHIV